MVMSVTNKIGGRENIVPAIKSLTYNSIVCLSMHGRRLNTFTKLSRSEVETFFLNGVVKHASRPTESKVTSWLPPVPSFPHSMPSYRQRVNTLLFPAHQVMLTAPSCPLSSYIKATPSELSHHQRSKTILTMAASLSLLLLATSALVSLASANFNDDFDITWGDGRGKIFNNGQSLTLSLDKYSGSGFQSKQEYLFGKIEMQLKLVPGNSAGTVTTLYLSSQGPTHDEIDMEFLGNSTGEPYTLHTNIFAHGKGNREQQFRLWFDPTKDFHTYSILWNPRHIIFSVDGTPIRDFKNLESRGVGFPTDQPMTIYSSLWNADDWATQGGRVKADWSKAPFTASYTNFNAHTCVSGACPSDNKPASVSDSAWYNQELDSASHRRLRWVQRNFMIYNYCTDRPRFPQGLPTECSIA